MRAPHDPSGHAEPSCDVRRMPGGPSVPRFFLGWLRPVLEELDTDGHRRLVMHTSPFSSQYMNNRIVYQMESAIPAPVHSMEPHAWLRIGESARLPPMFAQNMSKTAI